MTITTIQITASNARKSSLVDPESAVDAVDADFRIDLTAGTEIRTHEGSVTLIRDHLGDYAPWGELENWIDSRSIRFVREAQDQDDDLDFLLDDIASTCATEAERVLR